MGATRSLEAVRKLLNLDAETSADSSLVQRAVSPAKASNLELKLPQVNDLFRKMLTQLDELSAQSWREHGYKESPG